MTDAARSVFIVDAGGRVQLISPGAREFISRNAGLALHQGRLTAVSATCADELKTFVRTAADGRLPADAGMMVQGRDAADRLWLHFTRIEACDDRRAAMVLVTVTTPRRPVGLDQVLRSCFGLTSAETRVARALLDGATPREAAERLGVSPVTVRNQLRSIFRKTDVNRQAALIGRLAQAANAAAVGEAGLTAEGSPRPCAETPAMLRSPQFA